MRDVRKHCPESPKGSISQLQTPHALANIRE